MAANKTDANDADSLAHLAEVGFYKEVRLKLWELLGFKRAAVAVARKHSVIMHTMLKTGQLFNPSAGAVA